jgi:glycosyltransferase involved in cell wall biosynthesis
MKKQKILIVHNYYKIFGGEDTVVENEKKLLLENGHQVVLYSRNNDEINSMDVLEKIAIPFRCIFSSKTYREVKKLIKDEKIDIVHVHNTFPLISPSVYYAARYCNVPIVQTVHNFRLLCPGATFTRNNRICEECVEKGLYCSIKNKCYHDSILQSAMCATTLIFNRIIGTYNIINRYIALTEFNKRKLITLVDKNKISIKPNFVNYNDCYIDFKYKGYFLFLGRIDKLKGIEILLEAWKEIKESVLFIVGTGPLIEETEEYIKLNNINNIKLLGFKNKQEVIGIIKNSKALIVPSQWYEGFPMTIVESFSNGIPVIAGDIGNLPTIIDDRINGMLFKYNNAEELREKVNELQNNNALLNKLRKGAMNSYNEYYNQEKNYSLLSNIYNECLRRF